MLQVATFTLPGQQAEANEFLRTHQPDGPVHFNTNMIVVFYDDGVEHPSAPIAELRDMLKANRQAKLQMEIALYVLKLEAADLNPIHNKRAYEEKYSQIHATEDAIAAQDSKAAFIQSRIDELTK